MYIYNGITDVQQKLTQHCKSTIFKLIFIGTRKKAKGVIRFIISNVYSGYLLILCLLDFLTLNIQFFFNELS